jgi:hypothetical protein
MFWSSILVLFGNFFLVWAIGKEDESRVIEIMLPMRDGGWDICNLYFKSILISPFS